MSERIPTAAIGSQTARRSFGAALLDALNDARQRQASLQMHRYRPLARAKSHESSWGRRICVAAGRLVRLQWEYRRSWNELASLTDDHLRELRIGVPHLPDVAWSEAQRRVDTTPAASVAVGVTLLACATAAAAALILGF